VKSEKSSKLEAGRVRGLFKATVKAEAVPCKAIRAGGWDAGWGMMLIGLTCINNFLFIVKLLMSWTYFFLFLLMMPIPLASNESVSL
jgi:hypothetical protein